MSQRFYYRGSFFFFLCVCVFVVDFIGALTILTHGQLLSHVPPKVRWQRLFVHATTEFLQQKGLLEDTERELNGGKNRPTCTSKYCKYFHSRGTCDLY